MAHRLCANCRLDLATVSCDGVSSLYNPGPNRFLLCEPCFFDEDDSIEANGTNVNPERVALYSRNQPEGAN